MARQTTKKKSIETTPRPNTLLNFFRKSEDKSTKSGVKAEPDDSPSRQTDTLNGTKGRGNALEVYGNAGDPVVISDSDDDEPVVQSSIVRAELDNPTPSRRPNQLGTDEPLAGPSKSSRRPSSPSHPPAQPSNLPYPEHNPFPNIPGFQAPSTWPTIVNTASEEDDMFFDENKDGSVIAMSDDGEDGEEDGEEAAIVDDREGRIDITNENGGHAVQGDIDDVIEIVDPPSRRLEPIQRTPIPLELNPDDSGVGDDFDPGLEWGEPEDEGMGMEEEGDEEASDIIATPPPITLKRKRPSSGGAGEKVTDCPVCGLSLRGKVSSVSLCSKPFKRQS
jgi:DNA cross-link repair 1A protein